MHCTPTGFTILRDIQYCVGVSLDEVTLTHQQELRRGTAVLACLTILREPGYGYALLERLAAAGLDVDASTLYPLLRRLERQGLLSSQWDTEQARPRKYYLTSSAGRELLRVLRADWMQLDRALRLLAEGA